jgi:hypothetical protein
MTTDDAPRPALDAATVAEGRRLLADATPGPWQAETITSDYGLPAGYRIDSLYPDGHVHYDVMETWADRRGGPDTALVCWLRNHADALLAAALEREALAGTLTAIAVVAEDCLVGDHEHPMSDAGDALLAIADLARAALAPAEGDGNAR